MSQSSHDEFLEFCALSTSGELTGEEQKRLEDHLEVCPSCREAMAQYNAVVCNTIPALAPDPGNVESDPSWPQEHAEAALFERLALEEEFGTDREGAKGDFASNSHRADSPSPPGRQRGGMYGRFARPAYCYVLRSAFLPIEWACFTAPSSLLVSTPRDQSSQVTLQQQLSDAGHEREVLRSEMTRRDKVIADLRHQIEQQSAEIGRMKLSQNRLETDLQNGQTGRQELVQQRSDLSQKLEAAQSKTQGLQGKLDSLDRQAAEAGQQASALEAKVNDLNRLLHDREATIDQQQELLAHDRDIRDLMGARDLYVAEVYDVERTGETRKPYGRVFYTKGKSLIFYAYDLDQQAGVKNASTFQAWGRRGPDRQQALDLGVFYVDNASKKRWVLRFDDPKTLAQIDAVFVTIEPHGGSRKPSNKPLLFAYLRIEPNHP